MTTGKMGSSSQTHTLHDPALASPEPAGPVVLQALEDLVASPPFRHSAQLQTLLRYVVRHTLDGEDALLRERVIGAEVFGRPADYDTNDDPIVRIRVAEARKRLAQAYQGFDVATPVVISIPTGSYKAKFSHATGRSEARHEIPPQHALAEIVPAPASVEVAVALAAPPVPTRRFSAKSGILTLAAVIVVIALGLTAAHLLSPDRSYREFWAPYTKSSRPTLLVPGSNAVYRLTGDFSDQYAAAHGLQDQGMEFTIPETEEALKQGALLPARNSFVALGDLSSISAIVAALTAQGQTFEDRFQNDVSFSEVRKSPTIFVGGFNNPIGRELTNNLRFVMADRHHLIDRQNPKQSWQVWPTRTSYDNAEDYAIITRLRGDNGNPQMVVAGMGQYGTLAAAEFITRPESVKLLAKRLGSSGMAGNFQVVLHIDIRDYKPSATDIIALYSW